MCESREQPVPLPGAKNVAMMVRGTELYIYSDLSKEFGMSSSGKTVVIASSSGNKPIGQSNAFLGLNIFVKSLDKRNLLDGVKCLRTDDFTNVGDGCAWRVEDDSVTLCVKIDFSQIKERPASSGKSILLASTSGNKSVGATGVVCGLNCYRPADKAFDVAQLSSALGAVASPIVLGDKREWDNGFTVHYVERNKLLITYNGGEDTILDGGSVSLPPCCVGESTLTLLVSGPKAKKQKVEEKMELPKGGLMQATEGKVRNLTVECTTQDNNGDFRLQLLLDPTSSFGRSTSGKSVTVSSSGGFQAVVNEKGVYVCRINFNAYKPAPPLGRATVDLAVAKVLDAVPKNDLPSLSFKTVLSDVLGELQLSETHADLVKEMTKQAVKEYMEHSSTVMLGIQPDGVSSQ